MDITCMRKHPGRHEERLAFNTISQLEKDDISCCVKYNAVQESLSFIHSRLVGQIGSLLKYSHMRFTSVKDANNELYRSKVTQKPEWRAQRR